MPRTLRDVVALLNRLIQLDHDAIEACKAAMDRVTSTEDRAQLGAILADHRRHSEELGIVVRNLGGHPASHGDLRQVLTRNKVALGALSGERAVLEAVRGNEAEAVSAYADAVSQPGIPMDVMTVLERQLAVERRHHATLGTRLEPNPTPRSGDKAPASRR
jgi:uncharacterized protein (TIGR02284 family)